MRGLLNAAVWTWKDFFEAAFSTSTSTAAANSAISTTLTWVTNGVWIIFGVVGLAGVIYSIYLGVQLARADDQSKRDDAKKHLVTVIIALAVTLVLVLFFLHILPAIVSAVSGINKTGKEPSSNGFIHF